MLTCVQHRHRRLIQRLDGLRHILPGLRRVLGEPRIPLLEVMQVVAQEMPDFCRREQHKILLGLAAGIGAVQVHAHHVVQDKTMRGPRVLTGHLFVLEHLQHGRVYVGLVGHVDPDHTEAPPQQP